MSNSTDKAQENGESHDLKESDTNIKVKVGQTNGLENANEKPTARISMVELDRMVANSLKDIDVYESDGDDNDPDLMNELNEIIEPELHHVATGTAIETSADVILPTTNIVPELLKARIEMYKIAEANADSANDSSRSRRFGRGLATLDTMLKEVLAGKSINMEDIPPEVITKAVDSLVDSPNTLDGNV